MTFSNTDGSIRKTEKENENTDGCVKTANDKLRRKPVSRKADEQSGFFFSIYIVYLMSKSCNFDKLDLNTEKSFTIVPDSPTAFDCNSTTRHFTLYRLL